MRIALDARWIFREVTGIGTYTRELLRELVRLETPHEFVAYFHDAALRDRTFAEIAAPAGRLTPALLPWGVFSPLSQFLLPLRLRRDGIDLYHSTNWMVPFLAFPRGGRGRTRCVVTVHDVIPLLFPHHAPRSRKSRAFPVFKRLMRELGLRADRIVTDTAASAADIVAQLPVPPSRASLVRAVHIGVSPAFRPPAPGTPTPGPAAERTILYVGRADPYKNLATLIRAVAALRPQCPFPVALDIVGPTDTRYPEAAALTRELGLAGAVRWRGYLDDAALVRAYQQAALVALPSLYEGFGLPVVEGMACGTPVVCSNVGALREIGGAAAVLVPPLDVAAWVEALRSVLTDPARAAELRARGLAHAAGFTWESTARQTLALYEEAAQ